MMKLVVVTLVFSIAQAAIPPFLNCTRYLEPCVSRQDDCCGYPFYDCLSDGREPLCQSIQDFPELSAELLLRLRAAKDRGDPAVKEINKDVYGLLSPPKDKAAGGKSVPKKGKPASKKGGKDNKKKKPKKEAKKPMEKPNKKKAPKKEKEED